MIFVRRTRRGRKRACLKFRPFGAASRLLTRSYPDFRRIHSRASDEEASGRGLGQRQLADRKLKDTKKVFPFLTILAHADTRRKRCTHSCPGPCSTEFSRYMARSLCPAFRCPHRHVRIIADLALRCMPAARPPAFGRSSPIIFPASRMPTRYRRHDHQRHAGYGFAPRSMRIRRILDTRILRPHFFA